MDNYFYIDPTGTQQGPVSADKLSASGVTGNTLVWKQGMSEWQRAATLEELRPFLYTEDTVRNPYGRDDRQAAPPPPPGASAARPAAPGYAPMAKPDNYLVWAILSTIFCFWPTGIPAIVYSCQVDNYWDRGLYDKAIDASAKARFWSILTAVIAVCGWALYFIFIIAFAGTVFSLASTFAHTAPALFEMAQGSFI